MTPEGEFARIAGQGGRAAVVTVVEGDGPRVPSCWCARTAARPGGLGSPELDAAGAEAAARADVGRALRAARGRRGHAVRGRHLPAAAADRVRRGGLHRGAVPAGAAPPAGARTCATRARSSPPRSGSPRPSRWWPRGPRRPSRRSAGSTAPPTCAVLTHDPKLDDAALTIALPSDAAYVGAMGSSRAQAKRRERLLAAGMDEALLERLAAPIGLDLGAVGPGGDRAVDHGRGGGRAQRPRAAAGCATSRAAASTRSPGSTRDRRLRPGRRRLVALRRRAQAAGRPGRAAAARARAGHPVAHRARPGGRGAGRRGRPDPGRGRPARRRAGGLRALGRGPVGVAGLRAGRGPGRGGGGRLPGRPARRVGRGRGSGCWRRARTPARCAPPTAASPATRWCSSTPRSPSCATSPATWAPAT